MKQPQKKGGCATFTQQKKAAELGTHSPSPKNLHLIVNKSTLFFPANFSQLVLNLVSLVYVILHLQLSCIRLKNRPIGTDFAVGARANFDRFFLLRRGDATRPQAERNFANTYQTTTHLRADT